MDRPKVNPPNHITMRRLQRYVKEYRPYDTHLVVCKVDLCSIFDYSYRYVCYIQVGRYEYRKSGSKVTHVFLKKTTRSISPSDLSMHHYMFSLAKKHSIQMHFTGDAYQSRTYTNGVLRVKRKAHTGVYQLGFFVMRKMNV